MTVIRRVHSNNFTIIGNDCLKDKSLGAEALGVICYLIGCPHDWIVRPSQLADRFGCGRDKVQRILNDLIELGYIRRSRLRNAETGSWEGVEYVVLDTKDEPQPENQVVGADSPQPENPAPENPKLLKTDSTKKDSTKRPAKQDIPYSEEFENEVWKPYPRKANTSKKKAHDLWRMLNVENQARVKVAIPLYAAAMVREGRTEDKIKHLQFFLSERVYETVGAPAGPAKPAGGAAPADPNWYKTATRDQWARLLPIWRGDMNWRIAWGPAPGKPGCAVPPDMLTDDDLR